MANHIKAIKQNAKRYLKNPVLKASIKYAKLVSKTKIDDYSIIIESYQGSKVTNSVVQYLQTISNYQNHNLYTIYIVIAKQRNHEIKELIREFELLNIVFVEFHSVEYVKALLMSKYIFTNFTLPTYYQKNDDQIIMYHHEDVAYQKIGRHCPSQPINKYDIQKAMLLSDYLVAPTQDTLDKLIDSFDLSAIYQGAYVAAYLEDKSSKYIDNQRQDTKIFYHMILDWKYRFINNNQGDYTKYLLNLLTELDNELFLEETLFVVMDALFLVKIDFRQFKNIRPLYHCGKGDIELATSHGIISDYVPQSFDYHHEKRKVVLLPVDEEYMSTDNFYYNLDKLPYPKATDAASTLKLLRDKEEANVKLNLIKGKAQIQVDAIVEHILFKRDLRDDLIDDNHFQIKKRKNVLLFAGDMQNNFISKNLLEQLNNSNTSRYHFFILFYHRQGMKNSEFINSLPKDVTLLPIHGRKVTTLKEGLAQYLYFRYDYNKKWIQSMLDRCYGREFARITRGITFDYAIHYSGLEKYMIWLLGRLQKGRTIFMHDYSLLPKNQKSKFHSLSNYHACTDYEVVSIQHKNSKLGLEHYLCDEYISEIVYKHSVVETKTSYDNVEEIFDINNSCFGIVCNDADIIKSVVDGFKFKENDYLFIYIDNHDSYAEINQYYYDNEKVVVLLDENHMCKYFDKLKLLLVLDDSVLNFDSIMTASRLKLCMYTQEGCKSSNLFKKGYGVVISKRVKLKKIMNKIVKKKNVSIDNKKVYLSLKILEQLFLMVARFCTGFKRWVFKILQLLLKKAAPLYSRFIPKNKNMILYISYHGRGYLDNPMSLHDYMINHDEYSNYKHVWAIKSNIKNVKIPNATVIKYGGIRYLYTLARAKYWISNCKLPTYVYKHKNQVYLQTWHGTPLKRLAHDIEVSKNTTFYRSEMSFKEMTDTYSNDVSKYNYMVSPSSFTTEVFQSAFKIDEERLIETGYPRNDCLSYSNLELIANLKAKYNLPSDKKIILYAPTWRDNSYSKKGYTFNLEVDFSQWQKSLGDDYIILFKPHYLIVNNIDLSEYEGFVYSIDPSDDISSLYIISDILVTDYSSVFFDFSILKRPTYFYMYDLDSYRNELRGFYIDIYKDLPGDIFEVEKDMVTAIKNEKFDYNRLEVFNQKFNNKEDGHACKRVLDVLFK